MRPYREPSVAPKSEPAGRRDRGMSNVHPRISRLVTIARLWRIGAGRADGPIDRRLLQEPSRLFLEWIDRLDPVPGNMTGRDRGDGVDNRLVRSNYREKIAVAEELDRSFRCAP